MIHYGRVEYFLAQTININHVNYKNYRSRQDHALSCVCIHVTPKRMKKIAGAPVPFTIYGEG